MPTTRSPFCKPPVGPWVEDPAERFVPEHQPALARRRPSVLALDDLDVRPADADRDGFDKHRPAAHVGLGYVLEARRSPALCGSTVMAFMCVRFSVVFTSPRSRL